MRCPACHTVNPPESQRCQSCGEKLSPPGTSPVAGEELEVLPAEPLPLAGRQKSEDADIVSILIPYKNPKALAAYYCGFFAIIPAVGFVLGPLAILLGILAVRYASANPTAKGLGHAITGIVLGVVSLCCWNPLICLALYLTYFYQGW